MCAVSSTQGVNALHLVCELNGILHIRHGTELESDHGKSARAVEVEELLIAGHLLFARLTPGGPKINEDYLAEKASE